MAPTGFWTAARRSQPPLPLAAHPHTAFDGEIHRRHPGDIRQKPPGFRRAQLDRRPGGLFEALIERREVLPLARGTPGTKTSRPDRSSRVVDWRSLRTGDRDLGNVPHGRHREVDLFPPLGGDGERRGGDVPPPLHQCRNQFIPWHGDEYYMDLQMLLGRLVFLLTAFSNALKDS